MTDKFDEQTERQWAGLVDGAMYLRNAAEHVQAADAELADELFSKAEEVDERARSLEHDRRVARALVNAQERVERMRAAVEEGGA